MMVNKGYYKSPPPEEVRILVSDNIQRDLGSQPIADIMARLNLKPHDLVAASSQQLTHKMVTRACKGRKLTIKTKSKILKALNLATEKDYSLRDLFNY
jgi:hypothetical protein